MSELIIVDDAGVEISRQAKGRGRTRTGAVKQADGNYIIKASAMNATAKAKPADYIAPEYITVDASGTEIEPRTAKGRGRPKPGYVKSEDGQFKGHWIKIVTPEVKTEVIVKTEETVLA